jgi:uncharacterized protein (AIM24 family)
MGGLARTFLTGESFFTTTVEARERGQDVLLAAQSAGDVVLHRLGDELLLTSGAYLAADSSVSVKSEVQTQMGNSMLSGTGFFLLRAQGTGVVACASHGAVHRYKLEPGERRGVDNGHILGWTAAMKYETGLATGSVYSSVTSGEGLMCFFTGPGIVYVQSHKPVAATHGNAKHSQPATHAQQWVGLCLVFLFLLIFISAFSFVAYMIYTDQMQGGDFNVQGSRRQQRVDTRRRNNGGLGF